jgi:O-acetylserine/cysteine efflux transporter
MALRHVALLIFVVLVWGLNFPIGKFGTREIPPLLLVAIRFALTAAVIVPFVPLPRGHWRQLAIMSVVLGTLHYGLFFIGLNGTDAGIAAILSQLHVAFSTLFAAILLQDQIGWRRSAGLALAFAGVCLIAGEPKGETALLPMLAILASQLFWAYSNIQIKFMPGAHALGVVGWVALLRLPQILALSLLTERNHVSAIADASWRAWASVLYMALAVSAISYYFWYALLGRYRVTQVIPFTLLVPVFGMISGMLLLGERLTWLAASGAVLVIGGIAVIALRRPRDASEPATS